MHNTSDSYNSEDFSDFLSQIASYWEHLLMTEIVYTEAGRKQSQNESMLPHNTSEYSRLLHKCMGGVTMLHIVKKKSDVCTMRIRWQYTLSFLVHYTTAAQRTHKKPHRPRGEEIILFINETCSFLSVCSNDASPFLLKMISVHVCAIVLRLLFKKLFERRFQTLLYLHANLYCNTN